MCLISMLMGQSICARRPRPSWRPPDLTPRWGAGPPRARRPGPAAADPELAVHARQMDLDGLRHHVERPGDVAVALPRGGELRRPPLARRQRRPARAAPGAAGGRRRRRARPGHARPAAAPRSGWRSRSASRRGARASDGLRASRNADPSAVSALACSSRAGEPAAVSTASCSRSSPSSRRSAPSSRKCAPSDPGAPQRRAWPAPPRAAPRLVAPLEPVQRPGLQRPPRRPSDVVDVARAAAMELGLGERRASQSRSASSSSTVVPRTTASPSESRGPAAGSS